MSTSEKHDPRLIPRPQTGNSRISLIGRNVGLLALAILGTLLSAKIWVPIAFFLIDTFPENRVLAGAILSIICVVFFLCILGARMRSHVICLVSRAVLLFLSVIAAIASMEAISFGFISVTVTPSREGFLWMRSMSIMSALVNPPLQLIKSPSAKLSPAPASFSRVLYAVVVGIVKKYAGFRRLGHHANTTIRRKIILATGLLR